MHTTHTHKYVHKHTCTHMHVQARKRTHKDCGHPNLLAFPQASQAPSCPQAFAQAVPSARNTPALTPGQLPGEHDWGNTFSSGLGRPPFLITSIFPRSLQFWAKSSPSAELCVPVPMASFSFASAEAPQVSAAWVQNSPVYLKLFGYLLSRVSVRSLHTAKLFLLSPCV